MNVITPLLGLVGGSRPGSQQAWATFGNDAPSLAQWSFGKSGVRQDTGAAPLFPVPLAKFAMSLVPLVILGYMLGWMVNAVSAGWSIHPGLILLDCVGIGLALWRCKELA